ncbi:MAG: alpha/beta hydrolase [Gammaproteobacteria bacterium]|nr:alpha/beta hydrolase [Gammaproteobacteria bacterium]
MPVHTMEITEHRVTTNGHICKYLTAGSTDGPLIIFVHGWPELSISWRHQLPVLAGLGFHAIAPDLRGYGGSSVYRRHEDYAQEHVVADMIGLLDALGGDRAIWVGHDWGSPVVWNIASHHPDRCHGVVNLCVPYATLERGLDACISLVDRGVYPEEQFPAGQWDYQLYYQENFEKATSTFGVNPYNTVKLLFRKGAPEGFGKPAGTAVTRKQGGWFGGAPEAPDIPRDDDVVTEADLRIYAEALERNGFFGPDSYYMNHAANIAYAGKSLNEGKLDMPVLFLAASYDYVCETVTSRLAEPMRERCGTLDEVVVDSGHWMAQERPTEVNFALAGWLTSRFPHLFDSSGVSSPCGCA